MKTEEIAMIKTMLGEVCGTCKIDKGEEQFKSYLIEGECGRFWISEEELKRIKLPFLATKERKIYDENVNVPLKIEMFRCDDNGKRHLFDTKYDYKIIEAIIKGGYND